MKIRKYSENDVPAMVHIWNEVVEEGVAFPQLELLDEESGRAFFAAQTYCGVQMTTERLSGFIFSTRTMSAGAGTLPMQAMRSTPPAGESTSENSWFPIALYRPETTASS